MTEDSRQESISTADPLPSAVPTSALPPAEIDRLTEEIVQAIKTVYDPEIPADIYELGLIYKVDIADDRSVAVDMTLTTPNCPSAQELPIMVENAVASVPGGVGAALGPEPDVRRGPARAQHVVNANVRSVRRWLPLGRAHR
jgi:metal-sulfur cluster biosynthetic enzyme